MFSRLVRCRFASFATLTRPMLTTTVYRGQRLKLSKMYSQDVKQQIAKLLSQEIETVESRSDTNVEVEIEAVKSFKETGYELNNELGENILVLSKHLSPRLRSHIFFDPAEVNSVLEKYYYRLALQMEAEQAGQEPEPLEDMDDYLNVNVILGNELKNSAVGIHCVFQLHAPELIHIQRAIYYDDLELALSLSGESLHSKNELYTGRDFSELSPSLQLTWERYIRETVGLNRNLVEFILEVSGVKEDDDYHRWLKDLHDFFS